MNTYTLTKASWAVMPIMSVKRLGFSLFERKSIKTILISGKILNRFFEILIREKLFSNEAKEDSGVNFFLNG